MAANLQMPYAKCKRMSKKYLHMQARRDGAKRFSTFIKTKTRRFKMLLPLSLNVMIEKYVFCFISDYVQLGEAIFPTLIGHFFPSIGEISC